MSSSLEVRFDATGLTRLANILAAAGEKAPVAIARAINHTGDKARTQMIRTLVVQTGLKSGSKGQTPRQVITRALVVTRAAQQGALAYTISSHGGDIRAKYFGPRETAQGVAITPHGRRVVITGSFTKGGRFPNRVALSMGGQVFTRVGKSRTPIKVEKSGVVIPTEMVTGATAEAFNQVVERDLPNRLASELIRILG